MAGIVMLEDGSDIYASSVGLSGALERIAEAVSPIDAELSAWLFDVSERPAPFMDFDLRGLSADHRAAFWAGVEGAHRRYLDWDQDAKFSWTVGVIRSFHQRRDVRHRLVEARVPMIDLGELWFAED